MYHHPESVGEMVGVNKKGEFTKFEDTDENKKIDADLTECVHSKDYDNLELQLVKYQSESKSSDSLKYILSFYAVTTIIKRHRV